MGLGDQREAPAREVLDEPDLPQRLGAVEPLREQPPGELLQRRLIGGLGQGGVAEVVVGVEVRVVRPDRPALAEGHVGEALAVAGHEVQTTLDVLDESSSVGAVPSNTITEGDMHVGRRVILEMQERRVERRQAVRVGHRCSILPVAALRVNAGLREGADRPPRAASPRGLSRLSGPARGPRRRYACREMAGDLRIVTTVANSAEAEMVGEWLSEAGIRSLPQMSSGGIRLGAAAARDIYAEVADYERALEVINAEVPSEAELAAMSQASVTQMTQPRGRADGESHPPTEVPIPQAGDVEDLLDRAAGPKLQTDPES